MSCLASLFFGVLFFGVGAAAPPVSDATVEVALIAPLAIFLTSVLIWFIFNLAIFPGVEVRSDRVVVKKFLGRVDISLSAISGVEWKGGVGVRLKNGKVVGCVAFPDSLYSLLIGYRNFKRVALSLEKAIAVESKKTGDGDTMWAFERDCWNVKSFFVVLISYFSVLLAAYLIFYSSVY